MRIKFYLLPFLLFLFDQLAAQPCSNLAFTYSTTESRCVATGSITVNVTGGSGNYTFKATGPVTTNATSSNVITGLAPGYYTILLKDIITNCSIQKDSAYVAGSYQDPRFQITKTDATCAANNGTITVINQQYGRAPFTYSIIAPSPSNVGATNSSGAFSGLIPGEYAIQLQDSCGGIQVRRITIENYSWWFDSISVVKTDCEYANVFIRLKDNKGNVNTSGTAFNGFFYGYVINGDTTWYGSHAFTVLLGTKRNLTIVVRDDCGNVQTTTWYLPNSSTPSLNNVSLTNLGCSTFTLSVTGQNLTNPNFCLYNTSKILVSCNSTGTFTNLPYGDYCIIMTDACYDTAITRCFVANHPVPNIDDNVNIKNRNCSTFTAEIFGQQNLTNPNYCLLDESGVQITCNSTGVFSNLPYGKYCITVKDGCVDTTIQRCFSATRPEPTLTTYNITGSDCSGFNVDVSGNDLINPIFCLYDSLGNIIYCDSTGNFNGLPHGSYCVRAVSCGDTTNSLCFTTSRPVPSVGSGITVINRKCSTFSVGIWGQTNLTNPTYCLYDNNDSLIRCDSTGNFYDIPYGSYCIKIKNTCYDTTITRCFTEAQLLPSLSSTMQLLSSSCSTVSFKVNGTRLTNPTYCLYNSADSLLACNTTGTFNNYPYGQYCVRVTDGCIDTTLQVCQTFTPVRGIALTTTKSCTIGYTNVSVQLANSNSPFNVKVYHPNGSLLSNNTTTSNPFTVHLPALPSGISYKIVGTDNCGNKDSATIIPDGNIVTKSTSVRGKCPSSTWLNGSGDILASCNTNFYTVMPRIIEKNGAAFIRDFSSVTAGVYTFADLEPAQYVVEYTQTTCNGKLYDTVTVPTYNYPTQGQSAVYQCDNNSFSLGADVQGGVSPYTFQIIGSTPSSPNINTSPQSSPVFHIDNGTVYSLIRLRTMDACGNATLSDVSVLPLQNIAINASDSCFFRSIVLSVDTIPNATYLWYRKTTPIDSTLLDSGLTFNLPFFVPEQVGVYICKVIVNNGCLTRLSYFTLEGDCFNEVLPVQLQLNGKRIGDVNQLIWSDIDEKNVLKYVVERRQPHENSFKAIASVPVNAVKNYFFSDHNPPAGVNQYRLKIVSANKTQYTNTISLSSRNKEVAVFPNPVKNILQVTLQASKATNYRIEILNTSGQTLFRDERRNVTSTTLTYPRDTRWSPGMYILRVTDSTTGTSEMRKLLFE